MMILLYSADGRKSRESSVRDAVCRLPFATYIHTTTTIAGALERRCHIAWHSCVDGQQQYILEYSVRARKSFRSTSFGDVHDARSCHTPAEGVGLQSQIPLPPVQVAADHALHVHRCQRLAQAAGLLQLNQPASRNNGKG